MKQNHTGWVFIATAIALMAFNVSDSIADLQNWHAATTTAFVGAALKQASTVALAALGGKMLNPFGEEKP
ncbi:MAG TPA: hypothetical protein VF491_17435 [Vicinamibacterales bacterium]